MYMYAKIEVLTIMVGFATNWLFVYNRVCGQNMCHLRNFNGIFNTVYLFFTGYISVQSDETRPNEPVQGKASQLSRVPALARCIKM